MKRFQWDHWRLERFLIGLLILGIWLPRFLELGRFVTPDEPKWLARSGMFLTALYERDWPGTFMKAHPGVTITWLGAIGYLWSYPAYPIEVDYRLNQSREIEPILREHGYQPMEVLRAGRTMVALATTLVLVLAFCAARRLMGFWPAWVGFALIAFDPFNVALSRLLHLDGLVSDLMLLAILAYLNFLYRGRRRRDLLLSALAAGFAWLTKSPALFLAPFLALLGTVELGRNLIGQRSWSWQAAWGFVGSMVVWSLIGWAVFFLFFPAMWVDPAHVLRDVFSLSQEYATEGHSSALFFRGYIISGDPGRSFYPLSYLWRSTPVTLIGLVMAGAGFLAQRRLPAERGRLWLATALVLFAGLFTIFITLGAKKFDRYLLPVFAPLDLVAGIGWVAAAGWLKARLVARRSGSQTGEMHRLVKAIPLLLVLAAIAWQMSTIIQTYPYYISYYNPLLGGSRRAPQVMMIGWGEGLDAAAAYLNARPDAAQLRVLSWYPDGCFSYIFKGQTLIPPFTWPEMKQTIESADYVVMYVHQWQRLLPFKQMIAYFQPRTPEKVIFINGIAYAQIYAMRKQSLP
jgi:hypothetical protein